jgi:hypothetical protein
MRRPRGADDQSEGESNTTADDDTETEGEE